MFLELIFKEFTKQRNFSKDKRKTFFLTLLKLIFVGAFIALEVFIFLNLDKKIEKYSSFGTYDFLVLFIFVLEIVAIVSSIVQARKVLFDKEDNRILMPLPISLAHKLSYRLSRVRKKGIVDYLRPDGKSQVTVEYVDGKPSRIHTVLISTQHDPVIGTESNNEKVQEIIDRDIREHVIDYVFKKEAIKPDENTVILVNPSGRFVIGGPQGDAGLTGRKIIVDTYGGYSRHGGGAFSGKDPTKVDRSAAYASRYVAKNIVASAIADKCEIELAYAIGVAEPVSILVDTFGTGKISDDDISEIVSELFDLRPIAIINKFDLRGLPAKNDGKFYQKLAAYGHMGRTDLAVPWEETDMAEAISEKAEKYSSVCV